MTPLLAIDPGASGGFALIDRDGVTHAEPMPDGMTAQADRLREFLIEYCGLVAVIEKTGTVRPTDAKPAAAKFARHVGNLEAILYTLGIPTTDVAPGVWQRALGQLPKDKGTRKRRIKELMARLHPSLTVTLKVADALGILSWAQDKKIPT